MTLRRRPRSAALLRLGYRVAYRALQVWTFVRRPQVRGAMIVVSDAAGLVLMVRHTYGDRTRWELPGGWVKSSEDPADAARRETFEELGIDVDVAPLGAIDGDWDFKHEHLAYYAASWPGGHGSYDPVEIAGVGWFDPRRPPPNLGGGTRAVLGRLGAGA